MLIVYVCVYFQTPLCMYHQSVCPSLGQHLICAVTNYSFIINLIYNILCLFFKITLGTYEYLSQLTNFYKYWLGF